MSEKNFLDADKSPSAASATPVRLMILDPGHFHASLLHREMYDDVSPTVSVYAPLGPDLIGHLNRVASFNLRASSPTSWRVNVYTGPDFLGTMLAQRPGNAVVISGRNRPKIDQASACIEAGLDVLLDKPWILDSKDLPKLEALLAKAHDKQLIAHDMMTERFEITSMLQRELVNDVACFGTLQEGTPTEPAIYMESVHFLMKEIAGAPLIRPAWFFDTHEQGEALTDIGTHLVDLAQWTAFAGQTLDYRTDVAVLAAQRWPTVISLAQFKQVTGLASFPAQLQPFVREGQFDYFCNTWVTYKVRGVHTTLNVIWDWQSPGGTDTHFAVYKGTLSRIEARQTQADGYRPELYVVPNTPADLPLVAAAVRAKLAALPVEYAGVTSEQVGGEIRIVIPPALRVGHEMHFAQVASDFLGFLRDRSSVPVWERSNMMTKYYVTTKGTELSRAAKPQAARRIAP